MIRAIKKGIIPTIIAPNKVNKIFSKLNPFPSNPVAISHIPNPKLIKDIQTQIIKGILKTLFFIITL